MRNFFMISTLFILLGLSNAYANLRDPTQPLDYVEQSRQTNVPGFELKTILIAPERRLALINNQFVRPRDQINGATVVRIEANQVELEKEGKKLTLILAQKVKQAASNTLPTSRGQAAGRRHR